VLRRAVGHQAQITLRRATPGDIPALVDLVNVAYRASEGSVFPTSTRTDRTDALANLDGIVLAEFGGRIAGVIQIDLSGDAAHFGMLATDITLQGRGVASALIEHAEAQARAAGRAKMRIEVVRGGGKASLYHRRGYVIVAEHDGQTWNGGQDWGAVAPWHMLELEKDLR
jgi:ribosomal protein S18 acetylase RimI-like enzyme